MELSRRSFLTGLLATAAVAPAAKAAAIDFGAAPPITVEWGVYNGIVFREVERVRSALDVQHIIRAKDLLARNVPPRADGTYMVLTDPVWAKALGHHDRRTLRVNNIRFARAKDVRLGGSPFYRCGCHDADCILYGCRRGLAA